MAERQNETSKKWWLQEYGRTVWAVRMRQVRLSVCLRVLIVHALDKWAHLV